MNLVQVNVTAGRGSTGVIAQEIGAKAVEGGWESWIAYGREPHRESASQLLRIGSDLDVKFHGLQSRLLDNHGLASRAATRRFVARLQEIQPDIVHLHNIHGYYLNYPILFKWLKEWGGPVVWTLHDCWAFTGHCAHYHAAGCSKWRTGECGKCQLLKSYPVSLGLDRSHANFKLKKSIFTGLENLTIVTVSDWLAAQARMSFLGAFPVVRLYNGLDFDVFVPDDDLSGVRAKYNIDPQRPVVIGVAGVWSEHKGLGDFKALRSLLPESYQIVVVGLSQQQIADLPNGIIGIGRTADVKELVKLYSLASVYVNASVEETLGMTTIEAQACGTPAVVYNSTACPEAVDELTGVVVERGDVAGLAAAVERARRLSPADCRARAMARFNKDDRYGEYIELYNRLLHKTS